MKSELLKNKKAMPFLALLCALLWALAYPFIKLGYKELGINGDDLGSKVLFAGIRFFLAGIIVLLFFMNKIKSFRYDKKTWRLMVLFSLTNICLHYLFSYIGLGYIESSRGTVLDSMGSFVLIILSCIIFVDDRMNAYKLFGCLFGFGGIIFMNIEPGKSLFNNMSFMGDGMIALNSMFFAIGGIIGRLVSKKADMTFATGISMLFGGLMLCVVGIIVGIDNPWNLTVLGISLLIALTLISAISFSIYNSLIAYHPISKVAIFNAFIPVFGVIFACIILSEKFSYKYLIAGCMATVGSILANRKK